jgi:ribosomal protein S18 acetylase RimI-like enzyme
LRRQWLENFKSRDEADMTSGAVSIRNARPDEMPLVRTLFLEYAGGLGISLCFQDFESELATLPGKYATPSGVILLGQVAHPLHNPARDGSATETERPPTVLGVVALRPLQPNVAEMKRLYVRPEGRGLGLGRRLATAVIDFAKQAGYESIRLDTLPQMLAAHEMYRSLGFRQTDAYYQNPHGAIYLELPL